jgi:multidrug efflux pump subunit AcrB
MIRYFIHHPTAANLLMMALITIGLVSLPNLKRETLPDFSAHKVEVRVPYPGAAAADVEQAVCQRIEDALDGISDMDEISCEARESIAIAVAEMIEGGDFARFLDDVKTGVEAIDDFPEQTEPPVIQQLNRNDQVVAIAITGPMSERDLKTYAEGVRDRLRALPQVSQVELQGFSDHQLRVEVSRHALLAYGLSMTSLADIIARQSVDLPTGSIESRERELLLRFTDERRSVRELERLVVVGGGSGGEVRLGDIATITDLFEDEEERIEFNGRRAAQLMINKTKAEDALVVIDAVNAFLDEERRHAPPGVEYTLTQDHSSVVRDRLNMLLVNGWQGLILVFLTMWMFFRLRFAFWVAMGLPVAFLGGLFFMGLAGMSINMITMVALLIALGLLMDDAIVISENIASHLRQGKNAWNAAIDGVTQVLPGVRASFLTTVAVFGPLAFLAGDMGKVLQVLPVVLILVLSVSLIEAFLILPRHLAHALSHHEQDRTSRFRQRLEQRLDWLRDQVVGRAVDVSSRNRHLFIGTVLMLFLLTASMLAGGVVKFRAFPDIEGNVMQARVLLPQGTPLARTEAVAGRIVEALKQVDREFVQPEGKTLLQAYNVRYNYNPDAFENGPHVVTISADLLTAEERVGSMDDYVDRWRQLSGDIPDVIALNFKEPVIGPGGLPIDIRLTGPDLDELKAASQALQGWLASYRGVMDLSDDLRPGKPEITLKLREGATTLNLDAATIANQLRDAFHGITASEVQAGEESYDIDLRLTPADRDSLGDLAGFRILTRAGDAVPLETVAEIREQRGYARIHRIDGLRTVTVQGDIDDRVANAAEIIADTERRFLPELRKRFPSIRVGQEGQAAESAATGRSMVRGFALGLFGVFLLLSFQFRSYLEPLAVMAAIPLAFIGVVWGHWLMGLDLSMPSIMGFISLSGIVVNDSILLVEFLKLRVRDGLEVSEAARQASRERFRAVLLTSVTTIAGLLPLLAERSLQAQILIPLAASIVFGLLASTLLVLFVVPALFTLFADIGLTSTEKIRRELGSDADDGREATA